MINKRRKNIRDKIRKANQRIAWIEHSANNQYPGESRELVDTLIEKLSMLNNQRATHHVIVGGLMEEDERMFEGALDKFLKSPLTTMKGQKEMVDKGWETFNQHFFKVSLEEYKALQKLFSSDTFQRFKENFDTYSTIINEIAKNPLEFKKAIAMISGVNRSNKEKGKYVYKGKLDADAFIKQWRKHIAD